MSGDPVVREVREAAKALADEAGNDMKRFFANLRAAQETYDPCLLKRPRRRRSAPRTKRK